MLETIFSLLGLAAYAAYDTANTHKKAKQICQEKGWGDCRNPRSNENLQWTYFTYYVELKQSYKLFQQHLKRKDLKTDIKYDISYIIDPETGLWKKDKDGKLIPTTRRDRYYMAIRDFEELGYVWDRRYDPPYPRLDENY